MTEDTAPARWVIGVEEHAWTPELRRRVRSRCPEAGLAALRLILAETLDRHPDLQIVLGHWGDMLVPLADRADLLSTAAPHLQRRVLDYITCNLASPPAASTATAC
ncbi:hypothetical protein OG985_44290 [Streptomyces sp. NBC_00289]|uniref:hypothetical protein n=1 Tax=Streptomyces sp. NBC_00289 TaxID=2975703 RepID=UPI00325120A3